MRLRECFRGIADDSKDGGGGGGGGGGSKTNVGAIAGGVVGGVLGAALLGLAIFLFRRRKRRNTTCVAERTRADPSPHEEDMFTVDDTVDATTPYDPPPPLARTDSSMSPPSPSVSRSPASEMRESAVSGSTTLAPLLAAAKQREGSSGTASRHVSLVVDEDAGALPPPGAEERVVEHLPPTYNPDWLAARGSAPETPAERAQFRPPVIKSPRTGNL